MDKKYVYKRNLKGQAQFGADEGTNEPLLRERLCLISVFERKRMLAEANIKGSRYNMYKRHRRGITPLLCFCE